MQTCVYTEVQSTTPLYGTISCNEKTYKTVKIGTAVWMAENLNFGTQIPGSVNQTNSNVIEKYCYGDDSAKCETDGALYQWAEVMKLPSSCNSSTCAGLISSGNHQGICPKDWHVPKASEWAALVTALGSTESTVGFKMKLNETDFATWDQATYNDGNSSGFSAFPAGSRNSGGSFSERSSNAVFWEASEYLPSFANFRRLDRSKSNLESSDYNKVNGFSLRCVMN